MLELMVKNWNQLPIETIREVHSSDLYYY